MTFKEFIAAFSKYRVNINSFLSPVGGLALPRLFRSLQYKLQNYVDHPEYFNVCGTLVFCGSQGEGKTLTAAAVYTHQLLLHYPYAVLVTNTQLKDRPINAYVYHEVKTDPEWQQSYNEVREQREYDYISRIAKQIESEFYEIKCPECTVIDYIESRLQHYVFNAVTDYEDWKLSEEWQLRDIVTDERITTEDIIAGKFKNVTVEYWGLDTLKYVNNGIAGVVYFIDEIHLELNSLESKNISVEIMVEISQQRKQRKHIVGTSQRYNRMAKALREQIKDVVLCKCLLGVIQWNKLIDGDSCTEENGKVTYDVTRRMLWFHSPELYKYYDTYAKMRRYSNEWQGRPQMIEKE